MKQIFDMHCHSSFSEDSTSKIDDMCNKAIEKNLQAIAFTEHVDFNHADLGYQYFDESSYLKKIDELQKIHGSSLQILKGMEFEEPHLYPEQFRKMSEKSYDVIIGSVHMLGNKFVGDPSVLNSYSLDELFAEYYKIMLDMVKFGNFDVLGHLDFPKRYYHYKYSDKKITDAILVEIVNKGIALEINTSPLRKSYHECSPDMDIISRYAALGGKRITIGSDAHIPQDVGADFTYAFNLLEKVKTLVPGYFVQREFIPIL